VSSLARALAGFMSSSVFGTVTQIAKGKVSAVFLGSAGVGIFNQLTLFYNLAVTLSSLGFRNGVTRNIAAADVDGRDSGKSEDGISRQFSSSFLLVAALSLALCALSVLLSNQISHFLFNDKGERASLVALIALGVPFGVAGTIYQGLLNGLRVIGPLVRARMLADGLSVIAFTALVIPFGVVGAALAFIFLQATYLMFVFRASWKVAPGVAFPNRGKFFFSEARKNVSFGAHSVVVGVSGLCATLFISSYIIANLDMASNGHYVVAVKIATVYLGGFYAAAAGHFLSSVVRASSDNSVPQTIDEAIKLFLAVVAPIIVMLMATAKVLVVVFFTREFMPVATILLLLLPGDAVRLVVETMGQALIAQKKLIVSCVVFGTWALIYCSGAVLLFPHGGILGVAAAYSISQILTLGVMLIVCRRLLDYSPSKGASFSILRALLLVITAAAVCWYLQDSILRIVVCFALILVWGALSMRDPHFSNISKIVWLRLKRSFL
jgi:O-antigen/teichoic acid export membrane protein